MSGVSMGSSLFGAQGQVAGQQRLIGGDVGQMRTLAPIYVHVMLHCYAICEPLHTRYGASDMKVAQELVNMGLLRGNSKPGDNPSYEDCQYKLTEMGAKYVKMLLATPLPIQQWIDPRNGSAA